MLVRALVDAELRLPRWVDEQRLYGGLYVAQQARRGKAMCEKGISAADDGVSEDARMRRHQGVEAAAGEAEAEDIARPCVYENLQQQLCRQLAEADHGVPLLVAHHLATALALSTFRLERQRRRLVLERLDAVAVALADVARHLYLEAWAGPSCCM